MSSVESPTRLVTRTVMVRKEEPIAIPEEFRAILGLDEGGAYTVVQFDSFLLLYPKRLTSVEALEGMRQVLEEEGVTLDDLLNGLDEVRQEIYDERYALLFR
jgi:hypothetical protein